MELTKAELLQLLNDAQDAGYRAARGEGGQRRKFSLSGCVVWVLSGIMFVVFLVALIPNIIASYSIALPPSLSGVLATSGTVLSTVGPAALPPATIRENPLPPVPTPRPAVMAAPQRPSSPTPTPTAAWNSTEIAATTEAFYSPATLPTPAPEFKAYVDDACTDPERVAESAMLQLFCKR